MKRLVKLSSIIAVLVALLFIGLAALPSRAQMPDSPRAQNMIAAQQNNWALVLTETFEIFPSGNWVVTNTGTISGEVLWGQTDVTADDFYNPDSTFSAWPAAGGANAVTPDTGDYPEDMESWMYYGPLDLSTHPTTAQPVLAAELYFSLNLSLPESDDWLGVCIATGVTIPQDFTDNGDCYWWNEDEPFWDFEDIDLIDYTGETDVYIGWVFESDAVDDPGFEGVYIDEIEVWVNDQEPTDPFEEDFDDWEPLYTEPFDTVNFATDPKWTVVTNQPGTDWTTTTLKNDDDYNPDSTQSANPGTSGMGYPAGLQNVMAYGPLDLSGKDAADVSFSIYADLVFTDDGNPDNDDWLAFCVANSPDPTTFDFDSCDWWTGDEKFWDFGYFDLTPYAGQSDVYLAWYFQSNTGSASQEGVFIDEVEIWTQEAEVTDEVQPAASGLRLQNGDFENSLTSWSNQAPSGKSGDATTGQLDGSAAASVTGDQYLFQAFDVAAETVDLSVKFDYGVVSSETVQQNDRFCAALTNAADPSNVSVDLGCIEVTDVPEFARDGQTSDKFGVALTNEQVTSVKGQQVALTILLEQDRSGTTGTGPTQLLVDNAIVYATGAGGRSVSGVSASQTDVAVQRDANEPNDLSALATTLSCNQTKSGVFGDANSVSGDVDNDWFVINKVPTGYLVIDIAARTLRPASSADTKITLYDSNLDQVTENDDDGETYDSKISHNNMTDDATYYVHITNYSAESGPDYFYNVQATCTPAGPVMFDPGDLVLPPDPNESNQKAWTVMLYLNAEDQKCKTSGGACWTATYEAAVAGIEGYYADKKDFLNVTVLLDGPNLNGAAADTYRYALQEGKTYQNDRESVGEKNMGDPRTLIDFVAWSKANYPAQNYYLAIDDHGGAIRGASWDPTSGGDNLKPSEVRSAMKEITQSGQNKIDIFNYEACLMGLTENAYDLKDFTDYMIFYQPVNYLVNQYTPYFKNLTAADTPEVVARQRVFPGYPVPAGTSSRSYQLSVVDTSKIDDLRQAVDAFADVLSASEENISKAYAARNKSQAIEGEPNAGNPTQDTWGNIDLWDLADKVAAEGIAANEAAAVKAAVEAAVLETKQASNSEDNYENTHGISITFPLRRLYARAYVGPNYYNYQMSEDGKWDEFLTAFGNSGVGQAQDDRVIRLPNVLQPKQTETDSSIYLPLIVK